MSDDGKDAIREALAALDELERIIHDGLVATRAKHRAADVFVRKISAGLHVAAQRDTSSEEA